MYQLAASKSEGIYLLQPLESVKINDSKTKGHMAVDGWRYEI